MEAIGKPAHHRLQHLPVALVRTAFRLRLEFSVEFENVGVGQALAIIFDTVACEHCSQGRQNPRLPIDQSAVAVKADGGEGGKIHSHIIATLYGTVAGRITVIRASARTENHLQTDASAVPGPEDRVCSTSQR